MAPAPAGSTDRPPAALPPAAHGDITVEYSERSSIRLRGAITGRVYEFSARHPAQMVDRRDASALLDTHFFRTV
jgi:hypothetical protein